MALTRELVDREADSITAVCEEVSAMLLRVKWILAHNSDQAIDWAAEEKPAYIEEDEAGNIQGRTYSRQAVGNAIFSLEQVRKCLENEAVTQGDHLGNLHQLARPLNRG